MSQRWGFVAATFVAMPLLFSAGAIAEQTELPAKGTSNRSGKISISESGDDVPSVVAVPERHGGGRSLQNGDLRIGFDGAYKVGHWTPVELRLPSDLKPRSNDELALVVIDGDGVAMMLDVENRVAPSDGVMTIKTLIKPGRPNAPVKVIVDSKHGLERRTVAEYELPPALLATQELLVEVGRPIGLALLPRLFPATSLERPAAALVTNPQYLPADWLGYEGVDAVVVTTSDPAINRSWTDAEAGALRQWVRAGGKLILCAGRQASRVFADGAPLADLAPGRFDQVVERGPGTWESHAGALAQPMKGVDGGNAELIPTAVLTDVRGRVELSDDSGKIPLIVRASYGFGEVLFVATDLDQPPFANWPARSKLLLRLFNRVNPTAEETAARQADVESIRLGYTDLAGQLRAALGQFAEGAMVPFWLVFFLALTYAAAIFPLEYAIARWLRPRFEAAWIVLPLVLALGIGGVWYFAVRWKGKEVLVRKLEVVDVDLSTGAVRGRTWFSVYSPQADAYDLRLTASGSTFVRPNDVRLSWLGLPGTGLGGMNSQIAGTAPFGRAYEQDRGTLRQVPLAAWSSKAFEGRLLGQVEIQGAQLAERETEQPLGLLRNETGVALRDCVLFYKGWTYRLGTIEPGASADLGRSPRVLSVRSYLTGRRAVGDKEQATPYEPDSDELSRIAPMVMFHDMAGGTQYTSLSNRYFHALDLTGQLRLGRAVLLAAGPPATRVEISSIQDRDKRVEEELAFYRFVIPVDRSGSDSEERPIVELRLR